MFSINMHACYQNLEIDFAKINVHFRNIFLKKFIEMFSLEIEDSYLDMAHLGHSLAVQ